MIVGVPFVRVRNRIDVHVPAIVVPVRVHNPDDYVHRAVRYTSLRILSGMNRMRDLEVRERDVLILFFFEHRRTHSCLAYRARFSSVYARGVAYEP